MPESSTSQVSAIRGRLRAYLAYRRRYGDKTLEMLQQEYGQNIPTRNPHFIMGTMKAHPQTFIIIGILRSGFDPNDLDRQGGLF